MFMFIMYMFIIFYVAMFHIQFSTCLSETSENYSTIITLMKETITQIQYSSNGEFSALVSVLVLSSLPLSVPLSCVLYLFQFFHHMVFLLSHFQFLYHSLSCFLFWIPLLHFQFLSSVTLCKFCVNDFLMKTVSIHF